MAIFKLRYLYASVHVPGFLPGNVANILQKHETTLFYGEKSSKEQGRSYPSPYAGAGQHQPSGRLVAMVLRNQIVTLISLLNVL